MMLKEGRWSWLWKTLIVEKLEGKLDLEGLGPYTVFVIEGINGGVMVIEGIKVSWVCIET